MLLQTARNRPLLLLQNYLYNVPFLDIYCNAPSHLSFPSLFVLVLCLYLFFVLVLCTFLCLFFSLFVLVLCLFLFFVCTCHLFVLVLCLYLFLVCSCSLLYLFFVCTCYLFVLVLCLYLFFFLLVLCLYLLFICTYSLFPPYLFFIIFLQFYLSLCVSLHFLDFLPNVALPFYVILLARPRCTGDDNITMHLKSYRRAWTEFISLLTIATSDGLF
jgi:hypothetical protein